MCMVVMLCVFHITARTHACAKGRDLSHTVWLFSDVRLQGVTPIGRWVRALCVPSGLSVLRCPGHFYGRLVPCVCLGPCSFGLWVRALCVPVPAVLGLGAPGICKGVVGPLLALASVLFWPLGSGALRPVPACLGLGTPCIFQGRLWPPCLSWPLCLRPLGSGALRFRPGLFGLLGPGHSQGRLWPLVGKINAHSAPHGPSFNVLYV